MAQSKKNEPDTFDIGCGKRLAAYEFGNYVAGYGAGYYDISRSYVPFLFLGNGFGYAGMRVGGIIFNIAGALQGLQRLDLDSGSVPAIDAGRLRAYIETYGNQSQKCECGGLK